MLAPDFPGQPVYMWIICTHSDTHRKNKKINLLFKGAILGAGVWLDAQCHIN